jgi:hypothetical protein
MPHVPLPGLSHCRTGEGSARHPAKGNRWPGRPCRRPFPLPREAVWVAGPALSGCRTRAPQRGGTRVAASCRPQTDEVLPRVPRRRRTAPAPRPSHHISRPLQPMVNGLGVKRSLCLRSSSRATRLRRLRLLYERRLGRSGESGTGGTAMWMWIAGAVVAVVFFAFAWKTK